MLPLQGRQFLFVRTKEQDEAIVLTREIFISRKEEQARNQAPQNVYSPINERSLS